MKQNEAMTIAEFLEARIAEDEDFARHALRFRHARALAECTAKRAILADRKRIDRSAGMDDWYAGYSDANYAALRALAAVYRDHADYREDWAL